MKRNVMRRVAVLLGSIVLAGSAASAQSITFQSLYGRQWNDRARGGIIMTPNADYMVVGESDSASRKPDVYVAHIFRCGELDWSATYDLGGSDTGKKIRLTADNGYVIVGTTENLDNRDCGNPNEIFLMKIDAAGTVQWLQTYGGKDVDEGYDVQVLSNGYLIAGRTKSFGAGNWDAILIKTDLAGNTVQARTYGGAYDDGFYSCAIAGTEAVAVGYTHSYTPPLYDGDLFLQRVNTGTLLSVAGFPVRFGGTGGDTGRSVTICRNGDIAIAGHTTSVGGGMEGYLLRTTAAAAPVYDRTYGGLNSNDDDRFYEIQTVDSTKFADTSEFIVVGTMTNAPSGFGSLDMYVGRFKYNLDNVSHTLHGSNGIEEGFSIVEDTLNILPAPQWATAGYAWKGFVPGISTEVYVVRQWYTGLSGCNDTTPQIQVQSPKFPRIPIFLTPPEQELGCERKPVRPLYWYTHDTLCRECTGRCEDHDSPELSGLMQSTPKVPVSITYREAAVRRRE